MTKIPPPERNPISFKLPPSEIIEKKQEHPVSKKGKEKLRDQQVDSVKDLQESKIDQLTSPKRESLQEISANFEKEFAEIATSLGLDNTVETRDVNQVIGATLGLYQTGEAINSVSAGLLPNLNLVSSYIHLTAKNSQQIEEHGQVSGLLSQASKLLGMINHLSITIQNKQVLEEKLEALKEKKEELKSLDKNKTSTEKAILKEIKVLERNIKTSKFEINENIKEFGVSAILFLPGAADKVYSSVKFFGNIVNNVPIASSLGIAGSVASVIDAGYNMYKADVAMYSHERHVSDLGDTKLVEPLNAPIDLSGNNPLTQNQKIIKDLIDKRQNEFNARLGIETKWFDELASNYEDDFDSFKLELERSGLKLDESIKSFEGISQDAKNTLLKNHAELGVTLLANAKNQLKVRLEKNAELNQEFFTFKSLKSRIMYGVTTFSAVITIGLLGGIIAGGAFPPALLIIPGILSIVATVGLMALGMHHLYINKPNLANTYLNFVPVKLMINNILLAVSGLCLKVVEWQQEGEETALLERIEKIASDYFQILDDKQKDLLRPIEEQEMADITAEDIEIVKERLIKETEDELEIFHQEQSSNYWKDLVNAYQKNVDELEAEVLQARKDDFAEYSGFDSFAEERLIKFKDDLENARALEDTLQRQFELTKEETKTLKALPQKIVDLENEITSLQKRALDEFDIIAESLIKGEFWKDPESRAFIEKYAGIEFDDDVQLDRGKLEENTKFLSSKLKHIILKDSKELLNWVEKQNMNEVEI